MPQDYTPKKTLSPSNQFRFVCPIFQVETALAACLRLENIVMTGKRPDKRKGCQACMSASKCPLYWMRRDMQRGEDPYYSAEPKVGRLNDRHLEAIDRILVLDSTLVTYGVEGRERELIMAENSRVRSNGPRKRVAQTPERKRAVVRSAAPEIKPVADDAGDLTHAARTGDMAAALTQAAKGN